MKTQFEEIEQISEPDMTMMLELSDQEFGTTMTNMLRALTGKVDSMREGMDNESRKGEILRKNQMEMLEIKNTGTEMKTAFDEFISRLDRAGERIAELEDIAIETSQTEKQKAKRLDLGMPYSYHRKSQIKKNPEISQRKKHLAYSATKIRITAALTIVAQLVGRHSAK